MRSPTPAFNLGGESLRGGHAAKMSSAFFGAAVLLGDGKTAAPPKRVVCATEDVQRESARLFRGQLGSLKNVFGAAKDLQRLQGTWHVEEWQEGGKALAATELKKRSVFFGGNIF